MHLFPLDNLESVDTDGDGVGDNSDTDDDNDGVLDENDLYPLDLRDLKKHLKILGYQDLEFL